ncbi:MAG: penicillin-binding protein 2 [Rhodospirillales bacterium]|nr:penicillin-binding protein 2 [Rhodospirillales bacterium]
MTPLISSTEDRRQMDGVRKQALETGRNRLLVAGVVITLAFVAIASRLVDLTVLNGGSEPRTATNEPASDNVIGRGDITDRNGLLMATSLPTASLYADPKRIQDPQEAALRISRVMPELDPVELTRKMQMKGRFVWLARNLTPQQHFQINRLGLPGIAFQEGERRVYPHGQMAAHVLGLTNVDGLGVAGIEKQFDQQLRLGSGAIELSLDLRIQAILQEELKNTISEFTAIGGAGIVMDVTTGEVIAMASLPDFDPNSPNNIVGDTAFNRAAKGVYEMGSTFKLFTAAMALDSGTVSMTSSYDARNPIRIARFQISDYHAENRWLSVPEIILHSSNIGAAKMAVDVGTKGQQDYLRGFGLLDAPDIELPEIARPLLPSPWRPINTMTIAYGHGIAVSPVQLASGISALVNGGLYRPATIIKAAGGTVVERRVISAETSLQMRRLMRLVVTAGTGRKAEIPGYLIGGKTGTADKLQGRGYANSSRIASFAGAFPMNNPRYSVLVVIDEPHGTKKTFNYATGGWVAAPAVGRIVSRMGPLVGIAPDLQVVFETPVIGKPKAKVREAKAIKKPDPFFKAASWRKPAPANDPDDEFTRQMRTALGRDLAPQ